MRSVLTSLSVVCKCIVDCDRSVEARAVVFENCSVVVACISVAIISSSVDTVGNAVLVCSGVVLTIVVVTETIVNELTITIRLTHHTSILVDC